MLRAAAKDGKKRKTKRKRKRKPQKGGEEGEESGRGYAGQVKCGVRIHCNKDVLPWKL